MILTVLVRWIPLPPPSTQMLTARCRTWTHLLPKKILLVPDTKPDYPFPTSLVQEAHLMFRALLPKTLGLTPLSLQQARVGSKNQNLLNQSNQQPDILKGHLVLGENTSFRTILSCYIARVAFLRILFHIYIIPNLYRFLPFCLVFISRS